MVCRSADAFERWKRTDFRYRKSLMNKAAGLLIKNAIEFSILAGIPFCRAYTYGRELAIQRIREFVNIKTVYIKKF